MDVDDKDEFIIKSSYTEWRILQKLERLRDENVSTELNFMVFFISWTESISKEMILTFQHYVNTGRQWNKATFFVNRHPDRSVHIHSVLQAPVTSHLFRELTFNNNQNSRGGPMGIQFATALAHLLRNGRRVNLQSYQIGNDAMSALSDGLVTRAGDVGPQELEFRSVSFINDGESSEGRSAEQCLADGLALNKTLTSFRIRGGSLSDHTTALIVQSLIGHPSLRELILGNVKIELKENILGNLKIVRRTTRAICCLLASPTCKLTDLGLSGHSLPTRVGGAIRVVGTGFDVQQFIEQLPPVNPSIQSLELSSFDRSIDHDSANILLRSLWKFPNLKRLDLTGNGIKDLVLLCSGLTMTTPHSCLRKLNLGHNKFDTMGQPMNDEHPAARAILHLLEVFPELGDLGDGVAEQLPASVTARLDLNRCSGMLLRGAEIPLSVWAVVLAKVNTDPVLKDTSRTSRKANVIYHMLHGPVFEGRGHFD